MNQFRGSFGRLIVPLVVALLVEAGCSRPVELHRDNAQTEQPQVPFQEGTTSGSEKPTLTPVQDHSTSAQATLPFRDDQSLPAGTLLTVRLKRPILAENPGASGTFEAVVDEPLSADGNTVVPRGSLVSGRVESARAFKAKRNHGYVRLILNSIDVGGHDFAVQTSSLFAGGILNAATGTGDAPSVIHLEQGRRLTFRLTEPIYLASQHPIPSQ